MNHADGPRARLLLLFSILFLPSVKPFTAGGGPAALSWARAAPALRAGSVEEKQQLQEQDEEVSRLKEAVSQLAAGKLSKSQFEKIVREEEEAAAIRFEERILAKAEAEALRLELAAAKETILELRRELRRAGCIELLDKHS